MISIRGRMSHQAQAVRPRNEVSEQESLQLTRNLLRIAMFNISYIRGLFPDNYFHDKYVPALEMKIKKLLPMDVESKRLIDWLEKGVFDALHKKYLRTLFLTICGASDGPLVEEYICKRSRAFKFLLRAIIHPLLDMYIIALHKRHSTVAEARMELERGFSFKYASNGESGDITSMTIETNSSGQHVQTSTCNNHTPAEMKKSACKMVRTLVQLMHTLDSVPEEHTIIMKLHYYDDVTPAEYEPPFFASTTYEDSTPWIREPLKMKVGHVDSKYYRLAIKMKSVFDPCQDENDLVKIETCSSLVATSEDNSSSCSERSGMDTQPSQPSQEVLAPRLDMMKARGACQAATSTQEASALAKQLKNMNTKEDTPDVDSDRTEDPQYEAESFRAIKVYLLQRQYPTVEMIDILGEFPQLSVGLIEELVERLTVDGLLTKLKKDLYHIKKPQIGGEENTVHLNAAHETHGHKTVSAFVPERMNSLPPDDSQMSDNPKHLSNDVEDRYKMALLHTLQMGLITVPRLRAALPSENDYNLREFISRMSLDGFIENLSPRNRRTGRKVIRTPEAAKKRQELIAYFDLKQRRMDESNKVDNPQPPSIPMQEVPVTELRKTCGDSTQGCVEFLGSEVTLQQSIEPGKSTSNIKQIKPLLWTEPSSPPPTEELSKVRGPSGTHEGSGNFLKKIDRHESTTDANMHSESTTNSYGQHYHHRFKSSKVDDPIYQPPIKRIRTA